MFQVPPVFNQYLKCRNPMFNFKFDVLDGCIYNMSRVMRKPALCISKNKGLDQLHSICAAADQRLYFRYIKSTIPLLPKSEISSLLPSSVALQPGLCRTWSETPKTGFLVTRLNSCSRLQKESKCFIIVFTFLWRCFDRVREPLYEPNICFM